MTQSQLSAGLKLADLSDFITPSQSCVNPMVAAPSPSSDAPAEISLNDCLACSGCVTSVEAVLIGAQTTEEFVSNLNTGKTVVVSVSPQSRASLAAYFHLDLHTTWGKLKTYLKSKLGVSYVFDTSCSRDFSLLEVSHEFLSRYKADQSGLDAPALPMLCSACPGWVCYAEKSHGEYVLPYISSAKSPQQVMGVLVKDYFAKKMNLERKNIYHACIMPCFDKKLEASRDDFKTSIGEEEISDVDCVFTAMELLDLMKEDEKFDFTALPVEPTSSDVWFNNVSTEGKLFGNEGGSGGYLSRVYRFMASTLGNQDEVKVELKQKGRRNADFLEATLSVVDEAQNETREIKFAIAYGFRNIQNIVRQIKQKRCPYHFIEIMACPSGCLNGGGQIRPKEGEKNRDLLQRVKSAYDEQEFITAEENPVVQSVYKDWLDGPLSAKAKTHLHTQYHQREKLVNQLTIQW